ncbi:MAG TPA: bifunctional sugar-1-phosphate nucleotidylyltransferase/acetyltransferase [Patescibacteria group bacterium]|nr:bifunctional sugar-1-phosphate nucleotidylyltransferase/acetyltransferase [Patescibacteria group bacterium]
MQAVILAAGKSSRFYPFTDIEHKSLVSLCGKPIIVHTLFSLEKAGITNVVIIDGSTGVVEKTIGDGSAFRMKITYVIQPSPEGMGDALLHAEKFLHDEFFVLNAHHVDFSEFSTLLQNSKTDAKNVVLLAKKETAAGKYASVVFGDDSLLLSIEEKPSENKTGQRIIGIYLLNKAFLDVLKSVPKEHYNFEKALEQYAGRRTANVVSTGNHSVTLKYPWDLFSIAEYLLLNIPSSISSSATIAESAEILGKVIVEDGAVVMEGARIKGPAYIGKHVRVGTNAFIRDNTMLEEDVVIGANMEVKHSIILQKTTTHSGFIGDSIIGSNNKIAAGFITANVRLDRASIHVEFNGDKKDTGWKHFGTVIGNNVHLGIRVSTMPGVVIGNDSVVGPATTILKNVAPQTKLYTKQQETVEKVIGKENTKVVLFDIDHTLFDTQQFKDSNLTQYGLYEEVEDVLPEIAKIAEIGIFSQGEEGLQKAKLLKTQIHERFANEHVHIVLSKKDVFHDVINRYKGKELYIVDDWIAFLSQIKLHHPSVFTIWVKRGIHAQTSEQVEGFVPDATVGDLSTLYQIISKS